MVVIIIRPKGSVKDPSNPDATMTRSGRNACSAGTTARSIAATYAPFPEPAGSGMFSTLFGAVLPPRSSWVPDPNGYRLSWCSETVSVSGSSQKIAWVPFPWCTSQSTTATRPRPRLARAQRMAMAMFASMQKPIPSAGRAWCPGGRTSA